MFDFITRRMHTKTTTVSPDSYNVGDINVTLSMLEELTRSFEAQWIKLDGKFYEIIQNGEPYTVILKDGETRCSLCLTSTIKHKAERAKIVPRCLMPRKLTFYNVRDYIASGYKQKKSYVATFVQEANDSLHVYIPLMHMSMPAEDFVKTPYLRLGSTDSMIGFPHVFSKERL